ncbi:hypothetical protein JW877_03270 [bacterium]|nr:hypothetical protein [bacterium]
MIKHGVWLFLILIMIISCGNQPEKKARLIKQNLENFSNARSEQDNAGLQKAVLELYRLGYLPLGTTLAEVVEKLGPPDRMTGNHLQGGYSLGYGSQEDDEKDIMWLHFRQDDYDQPNPKNPPRLVSLSCPAGEKP